MHLDEFLMKFEHGKTIAKEEFHEFQAIFNELEKTAQDELTKKLVRLVIRHYKTVEDDVRHDIQEIEAAVGKGTGVPQATEDSAINPNALLNAQQVLNFIIKQRGIPEVETETGERYPQIGYELPFAINALRLRGKLPREGTYGDIDLSKPLYPSHLNSDHLPIKRGIKRSNDYYPIKNINKLFRGGKGDLTFLAVRHDAAKKLYVRGTDLAANAILASKIATIISPRYFSSERVLDNQMSAARHLQEYGKPIVAPLYMGRYRFHPEIAKDFNEGKMIRGAGIIDEVCHFLLEMDPNLENIGFSRLPDGTYALAKIDFDGCYIDGKMTEEIYEGRGIGRMIGTPLGSFTEKKEELLRQDPAFIKEQLYARLKLSLFPSGLYEALADKAYPDEQREKRDAAIEECVHRRDIAFNLFLKHPQLERFLREDPAILERCYQEIQGYIITHFDKKTGIQLQNELQKQHNQIHAALHARTAKQNNPGLEAMGYLKDKLNEVRQPKEAEEELKPRPR